MQDNTNPLQNRMSSKKKYFTVNYIHLINKSCQILSTFTNQCRCLHLHSQCLHLPHTHSSHVHRLYAIPQQIIISSIHCTIQMPSQSLLVRHSAMLLRSTDKEMVTLGFLILPGGATTWPLVKTHSPSSCS